MELKELNDNLKDKLPRFEDESVISYIKRLIKMVTDNIGYGEGFQKIWKYHGGTTDSKVHITGYEKLWGIALSKLLYYEPNCFSI